MKKQLLLLAGMLCFVVTAWAAPTAKAIYCAANTTLYFTYDEVTYNTSTAYEQLDGKTPTKVYDNISAEGYINPGGWSANTNNKDNPTVSQSRNNTPWCKDYKTKITKVKVLSNFIDWKPTKLNCFFYCLSNLKTFEGAEYINTDNVTSLNGLFFYCKSIKDFTFLKNWNVSNVTNFYETFLGCSGITNLNFLNDWDVSKAEDMTRIFGICANVSDITALSAWSDKVKNVKNLSDAFENCFDITNVNALSDWKFEKLKDLGHTFGSCEKLSDISGLKKWNVSTVQIMQNTFQYCYSLENVDDLSEWETGNVVRMDCMFDMGNPLFGDNHLSNIEGLAKWETGNVIFLDAMFRGCSHLTSIEPIYSWNTANLGSLKETFRRCSGLTRIDLSKWDLSNFSKEQKYKPWSKNPEFTDQYDYFYYEVLTNTFRDCTGVVGITLGKGTVGKQKLTSTYLQNTFQNCPKLRFIDFSGCTDPYGNIVEANRLTTNTMFYDVPRTCVIYLPSGNGQPDNYNEEDEVSNLENVVYTASDETLQCDKYYSEDKVDIELPHRFHADLATYERTFNSTYGGVILPYPVKINDNDEDEFQPFLLQREFEDHMYFKGIAEVPANTPFCFKRKQASTNMTFRMENLWVESTYDISGETSDNVEEGFAWKTQGFYVNNVIEPENGTFSIPTMDDYVGTETVDYEVDHVYYLSKNRFYRCDDATLTLAPHRILFYGLWEKYSGTDPEMSGSFDFEELGDEVVDAIQAAETDMDEAKAAAIYDASGNRLSETQHGLNILRMSDGSVKKVIKK